MASMKLFSGRLKTYGSDKLNKIRHCSTTCFGSGKSEIIITGTESTEVQKGMLETCNKVRDTKFFVRVRVRVRTALFSPLDRIGTLRSL